MKILISAFSCLPGCGSEPGVAWKWSLELAKAHEVVVLTDVTRRAHIEKNAAPSLYKNITFIYYRPPWLRWIPLNSGTAQILYSLWQYSILPMARGLHRRHRFDLVLHLTYGVFRHPSFLGLLGPPFVFGPLGGGEDSPWRLKRSLPLQEQVKELARSFSNRVARINPFLRIALSHSTLIFARTKETANNLPQPYARLAKIQQEIGIDCNRPFPNLTPRARGAPLRILFAGRLLGWKGVHLAIKAVHAAHASGCPITLTIVGEGPSGSWLRKLSDTLGVASIVEWHGHISQERLFNIYAEHHCFLFPSLHDSSGNVVLEALSFGLPVICLDLGGPRTLVRNDSARVICTYGRSEKEVVAGLAAAIIELEGNEPERLAMALSAADHARTMSWESIVSSAMSEVYRHMLT